MKQKIVLLNPPYHKKYFRDFYCSASSKSDYAWFPIDLVVLSGLLKKQYDITIIDSIVEKYSPQKTISIIKEIQPDVCISLIGSLSYSLDISVLKKIKQQTDAKIIVSGGVALYYPDKIFKDAECIDGIIVNFTTKDILYYLRNEFDKLENFYWRTSNKIFKKRSRLTGSEFSVGVADIEKFNLKKYSYPGTLHKRFFNILTSYGCPFNCSFCNVTNKNVGYRWRNIDEIINELKEIRKLGIKDIVFKDPCFYGNKKHYTELIKRLQKEDFNFNYIIAGGRINLMDESKIKLLSKTGCHTIYFGVESGSDKILQKNNKQISISQVRKIFLLCDKYKIRTAGFFILGLPYDTEITMKETIKFAKELDCYIASFNNAVPIEGSNIRDKNDHHFGKDISNNHKLSLSKLQPASAIIQKYRRKAVLQFYFRPLYILKRLLKLKSVFELFQMFREGFFLIKNIFFGVL